MRPASSPSRIRSAISELCRRRTQRKPPACLTRRRGPQTLRPMRAELPDVTLHYDLRGTGAHLVVLTHGLGSDLEYWTPHLDALAAHHRVLRWDLRGAGGSGKPGGPYDVALFARDLAALHDHLGEPAAHLVGHSGGGVVSQRFALDFPERTRSLVLVSTSSEVGERAARAWSRLADMVERDGFGPAREPDVRAFGPTFAAGHPEVVRELAQRTRLGDPRAYAASARAFGSYGWTAELGRVRAPALILQGLDDALTPPGGSVILSRGIRRSRLVMVPGAGHNLPIEMPALFVTAVLAFLAGLDL
ncbi:MAG: alpha/beta fold hydrolase [Deltaproteobacteria bacterium]|nr:MAG: alpha/beta fold hydrolase [Deltaproteobacteria bacterium]